MHHTFQLNPEQLLLAICDLDSPNATKTTPISPHIATVSFFSLVANAAAKP